MAEQAPAVQNKGMLVVAVVLGIVAVIVYNVQIAAVRQQAIGALVKVLQFERDMRKGEKIDLSKDVSVKEISNALAAGLGDVAVGENFEQLKTMTQDGILNREVRKGNFFSTSMVTSSEIVDPTNKMHNSNNLCRVVQIKTGGDLGKLLRPGARVNLVAMFPGPGGKTFAQRIVEDVWVLAVGGEVATDSPGPGGAGERVLGSYRSIDIEVSPQTSLELEQVFGYVGGAVDIEIISPGSPRNEKTAGVVKPGLLQLLEGGAEAPKAGRGGGGGPL